VNCTDECLKPKGRQAHCATCHATFTGPTGFDDHRVGGRCISPTGWFEKEGLTASPEAHVNIDRLKEHGRVQMARLRAKAIASETKKE
jgi:hypothetical protein